MQQLLVQVALAKIEIANAADLVGARLFQHVHLGDIFMPAPHAGKIPHHRPDIGDRRLHHP